MSDSSSKWLTGCGVGCAAVIVLIVILGTGGYLLVKSRLQPFEDAKTASAELEGKFGKIQDFIPDSDGTIKPERIKAFLAAREQTDLVRKNLEGSMTRLSEEIRQAKEGEKSFLSVMRFLGKGFGVVPELGEFFATRSRALLAVGMGGGEYCYIYVAAYYGLLDKSPEDGPKFRLEGDEPRSIVNEDSDDVGEARRQRAVRWIRNFHLVMFRKQLETFKGKDLGAAQDSWRKIIEAEVAALELHRDRLPWQDGLPEVLQASLQPFREQLGASYSAMVNPLELAQWFSSGETRIHYR